MASLINCGQKRADPIALFLRYGATKKDHGRRGREAAAILKRSVTEPPKDSSGAVVYLSSGDSLVLENAPLLLATKHEPPLIAWRGVRFRANTIGNRTHARVLHR
jgi:hypothetical protein